MTRDLARRALTTKVPSVPRARIQSTGLHWSDLAESDRVNHPDYGDGTVRGVGPVLLHIDWDNPDEHLRTHTAELANFLTRIEQPS